MAQLSRAALKLFFETGDIPTESQFGDLIDSQFNFTDDGTPAIVAGANEQVQYNNAGALGANANLTWNIANSRLAIGAPPSITGRVHIKGAGATSATSGLQIDDSSDNPLFLILDDGNVGIGDATPGNILSIQRDNATIAIRNAANVLHSTLSSSQTDGGRLQLLTLAGAAKVAIGITSISTDYIDTGMNFGIGTQVPKNKFHVESANPTIRLSDSDAVTDQDVTGVINWFRGNNTNNVGFLGFETTANENLSIRNRTSGGFVDFWANDLKHGTIDTVGNLGLGTDSFGTNAEKVLGILNGVAPTTSPGNMIQIYAKDTVAEVTSTLGLQLEQAVEAIGVFTPSHKIKIIINGTEYWIQLDAV